MKDWRGTPYSIGSTVLYPRGIGSHSVEICEGVVTDIKEWVEAETRYEPWQEFRKRQENDSEAKRLSWFEDVEHFKVIIRPTASSRRSVVSWTARNGKEAKPVTISITDNITAL